MERSTIDYATLSAGVIRKVIEGTESQGCSRSAGHQGTMIPSVEQALRRRGRARTHKRRWMRGGGISAAAALMLVGGWLIADRSKEVAIAARPPFRILATTTTAVAQAAGSEGGARPLAHGMILGPGVGLIAPADGEVTIGDAAGTSITLERDGQLTLVEQAAVRRFSLRGGAVRARVAKLQPQERFVITTVDTEIEVHGTAFRIMTVPPDARCGDGIRTRVSVGEGIVSVRAAGTEVFVPAGANWPAGCSRDDAAALVEPATTSNVPAVEGGRRRQSERGLPAAGARAVQGERERRARPARTPGKASSALAAANDLFAAAIRAKREKRPVDSAHLFSVLIDSHPDGPLAEGAMAQRMRVLAAVDRPSAVRAANQYLARFPAGFASAEARSLAGAGL